MNNLIERAAQLVQSVHLGRIMTPEEAVAGMVSHTEEQKRVLANNWYLCGDAPASLLKYVRANGPASLSSQIRLVCTRAGHPYAIVMHRIRHVEHRFLIPISEPKFLPLVEAMLDERACVSLGDAGGSDALILGLGVHHPGLLKEVMRMQGLIEATNTARIASEMPRLACELMTPAAIPGREMVTEVAVTSIVADDIARCWQEEFAALRSLH